jgi:hypothetical protein
MFLADLHGFVFGLVPAEAVQAHRISAQQAR